MTGDNCAETCAHQDGIKYEILKESPSNYTTVTEYSKNLVIVGGRHLLKLI